MSIKSIDLIELKQNRDYQSQFILYTTIHLYTHIIILYVHTTKVNFFFFSVGKNKIVNQNRLEHCNGLRRVYW